MPLGCRYESGTLLSFPIEQALAGDFSQPFVLFKPTETRFIARGSYTTTKNYILLSILDDVIPKIVSPHGQISLTALDCLPSRRVRPRPRPRLQAWLRSEPCFLSQDLIDRVLRAGALALRQALAHVDIRG